MVAVASESGDSKSGCWGGLMDSRSDSSATMFWHRADISRSVRSRVGRVASEREREASDDFSAVCR